MSFRKIAISKVPASKMLKNSIFFDKDVKYYFFYIIKLFVNDRKTTFLQTSILAYSGTAA